VASSKLLSTYFPLLARAKMAPQKVNPNPIKAAICNPKSIDETSRRIPAAKNNPAIVDELLVVLWTGSN
jgi:hypothetical protein